MPTNNKVFRFNIIAFFIAFMLGIFYVYISTPKPRVIIKYPTPYNVNKIMYQNDSGECFKFKMEEVKCTKEAIVQPIS
jgi:hypothetical protein